MTDRREGPPPRPLPPEHEPSLLDRLPAIARPLAWHLAEQGGRERLAQARECASSGVPSGYRFTEAELEFVVADLLELPAAELRRRSLAHLDWQRSERDRRAREALAEKRGAPTTSMTSSRRLSYAEMLGRAPEPVRDRHEPRRDEDADERLAISEEARA